MHESFLRHRGWRYLKLAVLLCLVCILAYALSSPPYGHDGGTWLGLTLGTIAAALVVWLAWLGVRKRQYRSNLGSVRGWTSAHVYLGLSLLVIATLHTGFQFGWNLHTLAYVLMVLVIASGAYGIIVYTRYPQLITENRGQATRDAWLAEITELNDKAVSLADAVSPEAHRIVVRSAARIRIGGSLREQLFGRILPGAGAEVGAVSAFLRESQRAPKAPTADPGTGEFGRTTLFMADQMVASDAAQDAERLKQVLDLLTRRNELVDRLDRDIRSHARMQIWLYVHIPMTIGLLAALLAHIITVFIYR